MEIERVNENTVKFFLSYMDIEERGFTREEVWYNREKSEELFWDMMDEINDEDEFEAEGPLWIQVHSKNNGIEVTVTRANTEDGHLGESPYDQDDPERVIQQPDEENYQRIEDAMSTAAERSAKRVPTVFVFSEFEGVIQLASRMLGVEANTSLYSYENNYYLNLTFDDELADDKQKADVVSLILEFGEPSTKTIHILEEYGSIVMESDVFTQIEKYF